MGLADGAQFDLGAAGLGRGAFTERAGGESRSDWRAILRRSRGDDWVDLWLGSVERFWNEPESFSAGSRVQAAIPGGEEKILPGERESGSEMQGVQAAQATSAPPPTYCWNGSWKAAK